MLSASLLMLNFSKIKRSQMQDYYQIADCGLRFTDFGLRLYGYKVRGYTFERRAGL